MSNSTPHGYLVDQISQLRRELNDLKAQKVVYISVPVTAVNSGASTFSVQIPNQQDGSTTAVSGIASPPQFLPTVGTNVFLALSGAQPIYQPNGIAPGAVTSTEIAPNAVTGTQIASAAVDSPQIAPGAVGATQVRDGTLSQTKLSFDITQYAGNTVYMQNGQPTPPTGGFTIGDLWLQDLNTQDASGAEQYNTFRWDGTQWKAVADQGIGAALAQAITAQTAANGANVTATDAQTLANAATSTANTALTVGPNQLPDPNFENGFRTVSSPFSIDSTAGVMHGGTKALKLTLHSGTATLILNSQTVPALQGHTFRVSGWWKTDSGFNGTSTNSKLKLLKQDGSTVVASATLANGTTYAQASFTYTVPSDGTVTGLKVSVSADNTAGNLWLDDVELSDITDASAAQSTANSAQTAANSAQTTANSKITTFVQSTTPSALAAGDLWIDTGNGNILKRASAPGTGSWAPFQDAQIGTALANAAAAQTAANGAQSTANAKITTFFTGTTPSALAIGDLWVDTSNGNILKRATATGTGGWVVVQDAGIGNALLVADTALTTGPNLIPDPNFEGGFRTPTTPFSIDATAGVMHGGTKALKVATHSGTATLTLTTQAVPVLQGHVYRASGWWKTDATFNGTAPNTKLLVLDQSNNVVASQTLTNTTTYTQALLSYTVPSTGAVTGLQVQISADNTAGNLWLDDVELSDITDANAALATAQTKVTTFIQSATPSALAAGDLWIDSGNGNVLKRASAPGTGSWVAVQDTQISTALTNAAAAQGTANARITTFFQASTSVPSALAIGDLWVVTDQGNILKRAGAIGTGSWVVVQDAGIGNALLAADTALVVGPNLVPDPNFENGFRTVAAPFSIDSTAGVMHGGTKALKLTLHSGTASLTLTSQVVPVLQGHVFRMSGWWKTDATFNGTTTNSKLKLLDQSNNVVASGNITTTTTYTQVVLSYTVPTGGTVTGLQVSVSADNTAGNLWLDDLELSDITDANAALTAANSAQSTASSKITTFVQSTTPTALAVGDLWLDSGNGNILKRWNGTTWVTLQDTQIQTAITNAAAAQGTANAKITTFYTGTTPTALAVGDLWVDTSNGNLMKRWDGSNWVIVQDAGIAAGLSTANIALTVGTNFVPDPSFENAFRTPAAPWSIDSTAGVAHSGAKAAKCVAGTTTQLLMTPQQIPCLPGQIWRISAYRKTDASYNGTTTNGKLRLATQTNAQATAVAWTQGTTYTQVLATYTVPSDGTVTALQLQLSNDHTAGTLWVDDVELVNITDAQNALNQANTATTLANSAQTTANGKITAFYQSTAPVSGMQAGDLWVDTDDNSLHRFVGGSWVSIQDAAISTALADANSAQTTANGKMTIYAGPTAPPTANPGDMWINTNSGNQINIWTTTTTAFRQNFAVNPSFEFDAAGTRSSLTGWTNYTSGTVGTVTRSIVTTGGVTNRSRAAKVVSSSQAATVGAAVGYQQVFGNAAPGDVWRCSATFQLAVTGANFVPYLLFEWLDASSNVLGSGNATGSGSSTSGQTLTYTSGVLPANTSQARLTLARRTAATTGSALANSDIVIDSVLVESNRATNATTTYFDGASGGSAVWADVADDSTSQIYEQGTTGPAGWQPRLLQTGAFQPNSIVAKDIIATGTISAALLESLLVLTGTVIAGDQNSDHAALTPDGLHLYRTVSGEGVQEVGQLAIGNAGTDLQFVDASNHQVAEIDENGEATFVSLNVDNDPVFQGTPLSLWLTNCTGVGNGATTGNFRGAQNYYGFVAQTGTGITSEVGLHEIGVYVDTTRQYLVIPEVPVQANNTAGWCNIGIRDKGGTGNFTNLSDPLVYFRTFPLNHTLPTTIGYPALYRPSATGNTRLLLTMAAGGTGTSMSVVNSAGTAPVLTLVDLGPAKQITATQNNITSGGSGGSSTQPKQQYYVELSPAGTATYSGSGTHRTDTTDIVQGLDPSGFNGQGKGYWWFTLPSITGTVDRVDWYVYNNWSYYNSGGTALWNASTATGTGTPSFTKIFGSDDQVAGYPKPGPVTITLPSSWYNSFKSSASPRVASITAGPDGTGNEQYYCRFDGPSARLRIWFTQ